MNSFEKGLFFENLANSILIDRGLEIVESRIKSRLGEIDILAKKEDAFYIVEVKHRKSLDESAYSISEPQFNRSLATFFDFIEKNSLSFEKYFYLVFLFTKKKYKIINVTTFSDELTKLKI